MNIMLMEKRANIHQPDPIAKILLALFVCCAQVWGKKRSPIGLLKLTHSDINAFESIVQAQMFIVKPLSSRHAPIQSVYAPFRIEKRKNPFHVIYYMAYTHVQNSKLSALFLNSCLVISSGPLLLCCHL